MRQNMILTDKAPQQNQCNDNGFQAEISAHGMAE